MDENSKIFDEPLGILIDEAVAISPRAAVRRWKMIPSNGNPFCAGLLICATSSSPVFSVLLRLFGSDKKIPASYMRMRTIKNAYVQAANRTWTVGCHTVDPEAYILATIDQDAMNLLREYLEL